MQVPIIHTPNCLFDQEQGWSKSAPKLQLCYSVKSKLIIFYLNSLVHLKIESEIAVIKNLSSHYLVKFLGIQQGFIF